MRARRTVRTAAVVAGHEYDVVHTNSEFVDQPSDHDPQVARLQLGIGPAGLPPRPRNRPRRWGA